MHVLAVALALFALGLTVARSLGGDIEKDPSLAWRPVAADSATAPTAPSLPPTQGRHPKATTDPR